MTSKDDVLIPAKKRGEVMNEALIFIKPHASKSRKIKELVTRMLADFGVEVLAEGILDGKTIDQGEIIDQHYAHIAKIALKMKPDELVVEKEIQECFASQFRETWISALPKIVNLGEFQKQNGSLTMVEINAIWDKSTKFKLGPGTYIGKLEGKDQYLLNGFYGSMREIYTDKNATVVWFTVKFSEDLISWKDFRQNIVGSTDPSKAAPGSIRRTILDRYEELGLVLAPNTGLNGIHASASPFEALRERTVWLKAKVQEDSFGKQLQAAGVPQNNIQDWLENKLVTIAGETGNAFDLLEDKNTSECIRLAQNN